MLASPLRAYLVCGRTPGGYGFEGNWSNDRECSLDRSSLWPALAPDQFFESKALERLLSRGITGRQRALAAASQQLLLVLFRLLKGDGAASSELTIRWKVRVCSSYN